MLEILYPVSSVDTTISPLVLALAVLLIIPKLAFVNSPGAPSVLAVPMPLVLIELAYVTAPIVPISDSWPMREPEGLLAYILECPFDTVKVALIDTIS